MSTIVKAVIYAPEDEKLLSIEMSPGNPSVALTFTYDEENDDGTDDDSDGITLQVTAGGGPDDVESLLQMLGYAIDLLEAAAGYEKGD